MIDGGHAALCPPYTRRHPRNKISKTTPCKVGLVPRGGSRNDARVCVLRVIDAVDAKPEQAKELAPVLRKVGQFAERFRREQRPSPQHFGLDFGRKLPIVDPNALGLVYFDTPAKARPEQAIDLFDASFVEP